MLKPYFQNEHGVLYHGDCIEVMQELDLSKVDLCLTDFPYGNETEYDSYDDTENNLLILIHSVMPYILKHKMTALITTGIKNIWLYPRPKWILNWTTPAGTGCSPWGFCCWQPILAYGNDPYLKNASGSLPDAIVHTEISEKNGHPCPKPLKLWKWLLLRGSYKEDDLILDPFLGSGTTAVACVKLRRKFIGIEISEKYCEIAAKRIEAHSRQLSIFDTFNQ